jgi:hypothetical protein
VRITKENLLAKLEQLDMRLLNLWVDEDPDLSDDDRWEIFAVLLETRVELLGALRTAGVRLPPESCLPPWLDRLTSRKRELRLRELKSVMDEKKKRAPMAVYRGIAENTGEENP